MLHYISSNHTDEDWCRQKKSPALFGAGDTFFLLFVALQKRSSRLDLALLHIARALLVAAELIGELAETAA